MPKILIADDSIAVRKVAERLLTEAGMGVTLAANGSEALALVSKDRPDVIVSDVIMPDKSGYEVCSFIRGQANLADIPVLLISGIVNEEVSKQAEFCKADGVLKKPFQGSSLKDRVLELLTKCQSKIAENTGPTSAATAEKALPIERYSTTSLPLGTDMPSIPHPVTDASLNVPIGLGPVASSVDSTRSTNTMFPSGELLAQREARIAELEQELEAQSRQNQERTQDMQRTIDEHRSQIEELRSRAEMLEQTLADEQGHRAALSEQLADFSRQVRRLDELEGALSEERQRNETLVQQVTESERKVLRIPELEAALAAEQDAACQLVQQITQLEEAEKRAVTLSGELDQERETVEVLRHRCAELEACAAQVPLMEEALGRERARAVELDDLLSTEREAAIVLQERVAQLEQATRQNAELEKGLVEERERSTDLAQRLAEAEQRAELSGQRFEDLVRKLGEIAGLASQLNQGNR
ncbi:response regulator [Nitrospirales bacterium NOB]|nr:MAG: putative response regulator [Nitrospira sp. OLB3]MBV6470869.1 Regulator of RpoS [Nitrospirota bacterium]MCE7966633.1 response regulator [Nitrospira sp. NTP2]MCK6494102.1 response regulator [Nitrospira sp.]MDL1888281.1 response regulator [Nitrospirales bacterium NOB]